MNQRVILDTIASVKYYLIANNNEKFLPYNYNRIIEASTKMNVKTYNAYKGNNTLLQGCVLDESSHLVVTPVFEDKTIPYEETYMIMENLKVETIYPLDVYTATS